ncbi:MAG: sigma-70 family RNA polymerase sigma factor [Capsulimonadales bacterium]|nr:sigma-70 family RNA polymerase sigma factor [Capsulimonadales bacterium]
MTTYLKNTRRTPASTAPLAGVRNTAPGDSTLRVMNRARKGDVVAQDRLRETLRPRLESLAGYYASRTGMDAADLLQEAWVAVFEALPSVDMNVGTPTQYLLKHARWQILDHIRWNKRRSHDALDETYAETTEAEDSAFGTGSIAPGTSEVETKMLVEDLERRLNARQKAILQGLLDGCTWRQIGDTLGCTSANVAYHVRGIRQAYSDMTGKH